MRVCLKGNEKVSPLAVETTGDGTREFLDA